MRSDRATAASFGEGASGAGLPDVRTVLVDTVVVDDDGGDVITVPEAPHPAANRANVALTIQPAAVRRVLISSIHMHPN